MSGRARLDVGAESEAQLWVGHPSAITDLAVHSVERVPPSRVILASDTPMTVELGKSRRAHRH